METDSKARVALITGSGRRRVGNVIASYLAERGFSISLHYHSSEEEAEEAVREIRNLGVDCEAYRANVALESDVDRMFDEALQRFGRLDVLVTTASIWDTTPLEEVTADDVLRNFSVNTLGTFLCARRAGLAMCKQEEGGAIITIGDWSIERPYLDHTAYFISKGAIPTLTKALAVELAHRNPKVRVNCIHPGPVMFPPDTGDAERQHLLESTLTKNPDCPESVAQAVEFLIDNKFVTGVSLPVDGGRTIFASEATSRKRPI
jgi:pteridine reductase